MQAAPPTLRRARGQVAGEPAYDTLRTKEQLGYSVHAGVRLTHGMLGYGVNVVSGARGGPGAPAWLPGSPAGGGARSALDYLRRTCAASSTWSEVPEAFGRKAVPLLGA